MRQRELDLIERPMMVKRPNYIVTVLDLPTLESEKAHGFLFLSFAKANLFKIYFCNLL